MIKITPAIDSSHPESDYENKPLRSGILIKYTMLKIESPNETYLLDMPVEVLHRESLEWLEEIECMKDEAAFFFGLIIRRLKTPYDPLNTEELKSIETHLIFISTNMLAMLHDAVVKHERFFVKDD